MSKPEEQKAAAEATPKAEGTVKEEKPKGNARQPKQTAKAKSAECAGCAKPLTKKKWYYRNGSFYCTKKCHLRKVEEARKKTEGEKQK